MKNKGSALAYVLIILSALLIVCTGVSSYVVGTSKINKSYSIAIDNGLKLNSVLSIAREYIIAEINKKKSIISNESDISNIKHNINDISYSDAKKSIDIINELNCNVDITRSGNWPNYIYEIEVSDSEAKEKQYQNVYFNVNSNIISSGDITVSPYDKPKQKNEEVDLNIPEWNNGKYNIGDKVVYNGIVYIARNSLGTNSNARPDLYSNWIPLNEPIEWTGSIGYTNKFKTIYNGVLYEVTKEVSNSNNNPELWGDWNPISDQPLEWMNTKSYKKGDRVIYNGFLYEAIHDISNSNNDPDKFNNWKKISDEPIEWMNTKVYHKGDMVVYRGVLYRAKKDLSNQDNSPDKFDNWSIVSDWPLEWNRNLAYKKDQEVVYEGILYKAYNDVSNSDNKPYKFDSWKIVSDYTAEFNIEKAYRQNDEVIYNGALYKAKGNISNSSGTPESNKYNWEKIEDNSRKYWSSNDSNFNKGDEVIYNGYKYRARIATTERPDIGYDWEIINDKVPYWISTKGYKSGESVIYNGVLYTARQDTQGENPLKENVWKVTGGDPEQWIEGKVYKIGEIIKYGSFQYKAINATSAEPSLSGDWQLISSKPYYYVSGKKYITGEKVTYNGDIYEYIASESKDVEPKPDSVEWHIIADNNEIPYWRNTNYKAGDKIMYNGIIYEALTDIKYTTITNNIKYPDKGYEWKVVVENALYWIKGKGYFNGQKVVYNGVVYIVNSEKTVSNPSEGYDWVIEGEYPQYWLPNKGYEVGNKVVYNGQVYTAKVRNQGKKPIETGYWQ